MASWRYTQATEHFLKIQSEILEKVLEMNHPDSESERSDNQETVKHNSEAYNLLFQAAEIELLIAECANYQQKE